jgi:hypothetical protein
VTIVNVSGTNKRKYEGQVNKPEIDGTKKNIKDFYNGKDELYNCNQPSINMVKYEMDKLLVDANSIWNTWKKPYPLATECEWREWCWEYTWEGFDFCCCCANQHNFGSEPHPHPSPPKKEPSVHSQCYHIHQHCLNVWFR